MVRKTVLHHEVSVLSRCHKVGFDCILLDRPVQIPVLLRQCSDRMRYHRVGFDCQMPLLMNSANKSYIHWLLNVLDVWKHDESGLSWLVSLDGHQNCSVLCIFEGNDIRVLVTF